MRKLKEVKNIYLCLFVQNYFGYDDYWRIFLFFLVHGRHLSCGIFLIFGNKREDANALPASAFFKLLLAQNNPYIKVAYFGDAYSAALQKQVQWEMLHWRPTDIYEQQNKKFFRYLWLTITIEKFIQYCPLSFFLY